VPGSPMFHRVIVARSASRESVGYAPLPVVHGIPTEPWSPPDRPFIPHGAIAPITVAPADRSALPPCFRADGMFSRARRGRTTGLTLLSNQN
jgi:hypothetical protein